MLRAIVIDDEKSGIEAIKVLAERNAELIRIVAETTNAVTAIDLIDDYRPDVVFLDINMPQMTGFELLEKLNFRSFKLVFTTAHSEYAIQAIRQRAFDYLLKPIESSVFTQTITEIARAFAKNGFPEMPNPNKKSFIEINVKDGIEFVNQQDIIRLEASRSYTEFYLDSKVKYMASKPLKDFEAKLDPAIFFRCHKSHIINLLKVKKFVNHDGFFALMNDGSLPEISRALKDDFLERLKMI
ncbi:MAG: LytR/AlgR family response regulator transcription factor [Bacteroidia bacterium]